jgi:hypothetical protein
MEEGLTEARLRVDEVEELVVEFLDLPGLGSFLSEKGIVIPDDTNPWVDRVISPRAIGLGEVVVRGEIGEYGAEVRVYSGGELGVVGYLVGGNDRMQWFDFPEDIELTEVGIQEEFENWAYEFNQSLYSLIDPEMTWDDLRGDETEFTAGSREEIEAIVRLIVLAEFTLSADSTDHVEILGINTFYEDSKMEWDTSWAASPSAIEALDRIISENEFSGLEWEYNDGVSSHRSGYDPSRPSFFFQVGDILAEASSRERHEAARDLSRWLKGEFTPASTCSIEV